MRPVTALAIVAIVAAACTSGAPAARDTPTNSAGGEGGSAATAPASAPAGTSSATANIGVPTGPAVLVAADYAAPKGKVDSTGAFIPANGKPTLVWVDAIW